MRQFDHIALLGPSNPEVQPQGTLPSCGGSTGRLCESGNAVIGAEAPSSRSAKLHDLKASTLSERTARSAARCTAWVVTCSWGGPACMSQPSSSATTLNTRLGDRRRRQRTPEVGEGALLLPACPAREGQAPREDTLAAAPRVPGPLQHTSRQQRYWGHQRPYRIPLPRHLRLPRSKAMRPCASAC